MHNKIKVLMLLAVVIIIGITYFVIKENTYSDNLELGNIASECAAIYASKETTLLGEAIQFLVFINPIDDSEDELSKKIRAFHTLAVEYYKLANEPPVSAKYLADYSIMHYTNDIKNRVDTNEIEGAINESSCNATLEEIKETMKESA